MKFVPEMLLQYDRRSNSYKSSVLLYKGCSKYGYGDGFRGTMWYKERSKSGYWKRVKMLYLAHKIVVQYGEVTRRAGM